MTQSWIALIPRRLVTQSAPEPGALPKVKAVNAGRLTIKFGRMNAHHGLAIGVRLREFFGFFPYRVVADRTHQDLCAAAWLGILRAHMTKHDGTNGISVWLVLLSMLLLFGGGFDAGAAEAVGRVTKVVSQAQIGAAAAVVGTPVHMNDRLRTGANARLQVTFNDDSSLTLGENANVVIDRFVYSPKKSTADVVLNATQGAFRFAGGKIERMQHKNIVVNTPHSALAVRGTHFWAGPIQGKYRVLLLKGKVRVSKR